MRKRRSARSSSRVKNQAPGHDAAGWRMTVLMVLVSGLLGMVFLFGGTAFWASAPFLGVMLSTLAAYQIFNFRKSLQNGKSILAPPGTLLWGLVVIYAVIRAFGSPVPYETWSEAYLLTCGLLLYVTFADLGNQRKMLNRVAYPVLGAAVALSMWSLSLHWHESTMVLWLPRPEHYGMRASGTFICPNHFAHFLQMGIILAVSLTAGSKQPLHLRLFAGYTLVMALPALVLTLSRAGWIGTICGVGLVLLLRALRKGWKRVLVIGSSLLVGLPVAFFLLWKLYPPIQTRINERTLRDIRITQIWPDTWNMIQGEGFWGSGPGTYAQVFEQYREHFSSMRLHLLYAHNDYLHTLAEYGWAVTAVISGLLIRLLVYWSVKGVRASSEKRAVIPVTMAGLLGGTMVHAVFDFNLHITANALLFVSLLGAWYGQGTYLNCWKHRPLSNWRGRTLMAGSAFLGLVLLVPTVRYGMGGFHEYRMRQALEESDSEAADQHAAAMRMWTPSQWRGWTRLGDSLRNQAFWMRDPDQKTRIIEQSREGYETALHWNSFDRDALAGLIELANMEGREEEALALFEELERIAPFSQQVQIRKALTLRKLGRHGEALAVFEKLVREQKISTRQVQLNIRQLKRLIQEQQDPESD
ncbi:MAG: O-antigen ligase family protein [Kiritimatiellia bacterium]